MHPDLPPTSPGLRRAALLSLAAHVLLLSFFLVKTTFFPGERKPFVATLRVDLVGLPDLTKQEMERLAARQEAAKKKETEAEPPKKSIKEEAEPSKPDEMALERQAPKSESRAKRRERMDAALKRMQALAKIHEDTEEVPQVIKGNRISKGTALTGEAKENAEAQYLDGVLNRLQANWSLPIWLSKQNLQAQAVVFINSYGKVQGMRWIKPSGNAQFDEAVKQCISSSEPFPLPPDAIRGSLLADGVLLGFPL